MARSREVMPAALHRSRPPARHLALLVAGVGLLHLLTLSWLAQRGTGPAALMSMAEPEFNRTLALGPTPTPSAPNPGVALPPPTSTVGQVVQARTVLLPPTPHTAPASAPAARQSTVPQAVSRQPRPQAPPPPPPPEQDPPPPEPPADPAPPLTPDPPQAPVQVTAQESEQKVAVALDGIDKLAILNDTENSTWLAAWPASTRLSYKLQGYFRGEFSGDARVQWQRTAERYQAQVDVSVALLLNMRMTSQGRITPTQLWPEAYEEDRRGKKRSARFGDQLLQFDNGSTLPRPAHLQDAASQFVQLAQDFATGRSRLAVGEAVHITLGRPGGVDDWTYDVVAQDTLHTPLGDLTAFHLKPRPLANPRGKVNVEMWFAPALQHLPARIKLTLNEDTWLDLTLSGVAQSP